MYQSAITILELRISEIIYRLKESPSEDLITEKSDLENAIKLLKKGNSYNINPNSDIIVLPEEKTPFSEFRIIEDHDSDAKEYWTEITDKGKGIRLTPGDLLIIR